MTTISEAEVTLYFVFDSVTGKFTAVYDIGFAYRNWPGKHLPSFLDMLLGRKVELLFLMRRFPMETLPEGHEQLQRFCYQLFEDKVSSGCFCLNKRQH